MGLSLEEVAHVARLARLNLGPEELERMSAQLSDILEHMVSLQEVDVTGVPATSQVMDLATVLRPDLIDAGLSTEAALANAPDKREGMFRVKAVFDE
jgi:aspartyl-tRNA(Asn)/glutamyl-tRNA(Gln) amidotransferase subunit C